jgi:rare lipoprotein A
MAGIRMRLLILPLLAPLSLSACTAIDLRNATEGTPSVAAPIRASAPQPSAPQPSAPQPSATRPGGYYQDDGPASVTPEGLMDTPDAQPAVEPIAKGPSRPYTVFDKTYVPITDDRPFVQRGTGSWYGKKFHGQKTASGEPYDMFKMTAAHPTLPIPSYARVTNLRNGRQVIVRINDRGPFHSSRIIDLSYTAALKLDVLRGGSAELEVERLLPDEIQRMQAEKSARRDTLAANASGDAAVREVAASGFYLQVGAYAQEQNAQKAREQLLRGWPAGFPLPSIVPSQGWFRLHSGPFDSRELASDAARRIRETAAIVATVVQR